MRLPMSKDAVERLVPSPDEALEVVLVLYFIDEGLLGQFREDDKRG
jgi:hypothetical protein